MLPSYGKIYAIGNKYIRDVLDGEVVIQEKIDGCVAPGTHILTADLRYVPAQDLSIGDKLIGFTDTTNGPRLCECQVTHCSLISKPTLKIVTDKGIIKVSTDHPFLCYGKANNYKEFIVAEDLLNGDRIVYLENWLEENTWEAGYLAGQFDGEGSLVRHKNQRTLSYYQKCGEELYLVEKLLANRGFKVSIDTRQRKENWLEVGSLTIRGTWPNSMRFLGQIRPQRLLAQAKEKLWDGAPTNSLGTATVLKVEEDSSGRVVGLSTSSNTYIAEGFLSHNSQFSFGIVDGELHARSRGVQLCIEAPDKLFASAVEYVSSIRNLLVEGWVYRGECVSKPKHNSLAYERVPRGNVIIFDIESPEKYLSPYEVGEECAPLGLEIVPTYHIGEVPDKDFLMKFLEEKPVLGGKMIEGIVIKNYGKYTPDGTAYKAKIVADDFKEIHRDNWKVTNPNKGDVVAKLIGELKTERRWEKAVEHLRDRGELLGEPKDIGPLMKEISSDVHEEEAERIKEELFKWAWPTIQRGVTSGFPEFYKRRLLENAFDENGG